MRELFSNSLVLWARRILSWSHAQSCCQTDSGRKGAFRFSASRLDISQRTDAIKTDGTLLHCSASPGDPFKQGSRTDFKCNYISTVDRRAEKCRDLKTDRLIAGLRQFFSKREDPVARNVFPSSATKGIYSSSVACPETHFASENASVSDKWKEVQTRKHYWALRSV